MTVSLLISIIMPITQSMTKTIKDSFNKIRKQPKNDLIGELEHFHLHQSSKTCLVFMIKILPSVVSQKSKIKNIILR